MKQRANKPASGVTLLELLVVVSIIGLLAALLLPAVQQSRESARRLQCQNNLRQLGIGLFSYVDSHKVFPPGFIGENPDPADGKGWGWGVFVLPFIEQRPLHGMLTPENFTLYQAVSNQARRPLLTHVLPVFTCPSDPDGEMAHPLRELTGFPNYASRGSSPALSQGSQPGGNPWHPPPPSAINIPVAKANYLGSFGALWRPKSGVWTNEQLRGNGILGCNTGLGYSDVTDGLSNTLAIGERGWTTYAGVWCGVEQWSECTSHGIPMVLGTVFYPPNDTPEPYHLSCDGRGSVGFSSSHPGGCQFVMCDGAIRFVSNTIDSENGATGLTIGIYQRLGQRNDGLSVSSE